MSNSTEPSFFAKANAWAKNSITLKLLVIGLLILIMLIPVSMVEDLIRERSYRKEEAYSEVSSTWGRSQTIGGPIIVVPIEEEDKVLDEDADGGYRIVKTRSFVSILPEALHYGGHIDPEIRKRGIYELVLYKADIPLTGSFSALDISEVAPRANVLWNEAIVAMGITEQKALREKVILNLNGEALDFQPGVDICSSLSSGVFARVDLSNKLGTKLNFDGLLQFKGNRSMMMLPFGKVTTADVSSDWKSPKYTGSFLPTRHSMDTTGFNANWKVHDLNRNYPQKFRGSKAIGSAQFGVDLFQQLDHYGLNARAAKYAVLMIALIFMAFFFMQILFRRRIHPIQFLLVGLSLTLFYTLVLSFSEQIGFNLAYLLAALIILILNTFYIKAIFSKLKPALIGGTIIAVLYLFIFIILQMEDYALITGSIGLLLVVTYAMYLTRNLDWLSAKPNPKE